MAALLLAAFAATNALSLVYLLIVALSMTLGPGRRATLWARVALPLLALLLVQQYAACIASDNPAGTAAGTVHGTTLLGRHAKRRAMEAWLGLRDVDAVSVGLLYAAFGLCGLLVCDHWQYVLHVELLIHRSLVIVQVQLCGWQQEQHGPPTGATLHLWKPLQLNARRDWNVIDHCRLIFYR